MNLAKLDKMSWALAAVSGLAAWPYFFTHVPMPLLALVAYVLVVAAVMQARWIEEGAGAVLFAGGALLSAAGLLAGVEVVGVPYGLGWAALGGAYALWIYALEAAGVRREVVSLAVVVLLLQAWVWSMVVGQGTATELTFSLVLYALAILLTMGRLGTVAFVLFSSAMVLLASLVAWGWVVPVVVAFCLLSVWWGRGVFVALVAVLVAKFCEVLPGPDAVAAVGPGLLGLSLVWGVMMAYHWRWWSPLIHYVLAVGFVGALVALDRWGVSLVALRDAAVWVSPAVFVLLASQVGRGAFLRGLRG